MKDFRHACFISYRNGSVVDGEPVPDLLNEFVKSLKEALTSEFKALLTPHLDEPVFRDFDSLSTADYIEEQIANALCHSACMLVVYTPNYFDEKKTFCSREYLAMRKREAFCLKMIGNQNPKKSLIFTVILRGEKDKLPDELKATVYEDFVYFHPEIGIETSPLYKNKIQEIAEEITRVYRYFTQYQQDNKVKFCEFCSTFELPTESEAGEDIQTFITRMNQHYKIDDPFS